MFTYQQHSFQCFYFIKLVLFFLQRHHAIVFKEHSTILIKRLIKNADRVNKVISPQDPVDKEDKGHNRDNRVTINNKVVGSKATSREDNKVISKTIQTAINSDLITPTGISNGLIILIVISKGRIIRTRRRINNFISPTPCK